VKAVLETSSVPIEMKIDVESKTHATHKVCVRLMFES